MSVKEVVNFSFAESLGIDKLHLLEVSESLLEKLKVGDTFVIRGQEDDESVVCTNDSTYSLRLVENSNTCLLVPLSSTADTTLSASEVSNLNDQFDPPSDPSFGKVQPTFRSVSGIVTCHYDLVETAPRLARLSNLLSRAPLRGEHDRVLLQSYLQRIGKATSSSLQTEMSRHLAFLSDGALMGLSNSFSDSQEDHSADSLVKKRKLKQESETEFGNEDIPSDNSSSKKNLPRVLGYSFESLRNMIQCSDSQLREALRLLPALNLNGLYVGVCPSLVESASLTLLDFLASDVDVVSGISPLSSLSTSPTLTTSTVFAGDLALSTVPVKPVFEALCHIDQAVSPPLAGAILGSLLRSDSTINVSAFEGISHGLSDPYYCAFSSGTCGKLYAPQAALSDVVSLCPRSLALVLARRLLKSHKAVVRPSKSSGLITGLSVSATASFNQDGSLMPFPAYDFLTQWEMTLPPQLLPLQITPSGPKKCTKVELDAFLEGLLAGFAVKIPMLPSGGPVIPSAAGGGDAVAAAKANKGLAPRFGYVLLDSVLLPMDARARVGALFGIKTHWRKEEIRAYVFPITKYGGMTLEQLLLKETRALRVGDETFHIPRL